MKQRLLKVCLPITALVLFASSAAQAEVKRSQHTDEGSAYEFKDDLLASDLSLPGGGTIVVRPATARATLIRPRVAFVIEMLKSVENL